MFSISKIIESQMRKSCFMLFKFFRNVIGCVTIPLKVACFWRIRRGCCIILGKSKEHRSYSYGDDDDRYDYAPATCLEKDDVDDDDDGDYDYAPTAS